MAAGRYQVGVSLGEKDVEDSGGEAVRRALGALNEAAKRVLQREGAGQAKPVMGGWTTTLWVSEPLSHRLTPGIEHEIRILNPLDTPEKYIALLVLEIEE